MNNIRIRLRLFVGKIPVLTVIICVIVLLFGKYRQMEYVRANETGVIEIENTEILPEQIFCRRNTNDSFPVRGVLLHEWIKDIRQNLAWAGMTERYIAHMGLHEKVCQMMFVILRIWF